MATLNPNADIQAGWREMDAYMIAIKQPRQGFESSFSLAAYAEATCQAALGWVSQSVIKKRPEKQLGSGAYVAEIAGVIGEAAVTYRIATHCGADCFVALYCWTASARFLEICPCFDAIGRSLRFHEATLENSDQAVAQEAFA
ncbi:hypothetical protein L1F30_10675 [Simiduia sp. 21SJ11W-1]|uniref:hypothetical protein n=1 Tax=Simiduia sp. 21SJ11W-1 TaxID=2909669 RepID=UPI00209F199C|nr:hypothetical protein [Simiduia sp. 21SJ11W-1]UTA46628.1 hypothetical protein L1F30_10675 [Simiduia sp. 21SJ11W-1]